MCDERLTQKCDGMLGDKVGREDRLLSLQNTQENENLGKNLFSVERTSLCKEGMRQASCGCQPPTVAASIVGISEEYLCLCSSGLSPRTPEGEEPIWNVGSAILGTRVLAK